MGSIGNDVKNLQIFLNTHGFTIATTGPGSAGHETTMFGSLTKAALAKFQKANKITPAVGYFGLITRGKIWQNLPFLYKQL
jgi:peptidoglycan hydrolase-like protein with peptidoglycan-binding domain